MSTAALADTIRVVRPLAPLRRFLAADKGAWWDFGAASTDPAARAFTPEDAETMLREWVTRAHPPVLREHDPERDGWGWLTGVLRVDEAEAIARGMETQTGDWLYAEIAATPRLVQAMDDGEVRLVSPLLVKGYTDDEGREWPLILAEVSFVAAPRLRTQPRPEDIDAAQLMDTPMRKIKGRRIVLADHAGTVLAAGAANVAMMADLDADDIVTVTDAETGEVLISGTVAEVTDAAEMEDDGEDKAPLTDAADLQAKLDAASPDVRDAAIRAAMDVLTAGTATMADPEKTEGAAMSDKTGTAALKRRVADLEARLEAQRIDAAVTAVMSDRILPPGCGRDTALHFAKLGGETFRLWAAGLPKRPRVQTERAKMNDATPASSAARPGEDPAAVRAYAASNGISYAQALRQMGAGR